MITPPPAVQRLGPTAVLLRGRALVDMHYLAALGVRETVRRDGIRPSPPLAALLAELADAAAAVQQAMSADDGHGHVRKPPVLSQSEPTDRIDTREAAAMLGITDRHARRLTDELMGRRGPHGWTFDRGAVQSAQATRQSRSAA